MEQVPREPEDYGRYPDGWDEDKWQSQMEEHPLFMSKLNESGELPPLVEAIQQLKFDPELNSKAELADKYRVDGNENFRLKKYKWAVDSYSEGIKLKAPDPKLNSVLYGNRAASHLRLGNLRSALNDSLESVKLDPENAKSVTRAADCLFQLAKYRECVDFCKKHMSTNDSLEGFMVKSMKKLSDEAEKEQQKKKRHLQEQQFKQQILNAIEKRGISLADQEAPFRSLHPASEGISVSLTEDGSLTWPVIFMYPEYGQTDFIQAFHEDDKFIDQLVVLFDSGNSPAWDVKGKYKADSLNVYFMGNKSADLVQVDVQASLKQVLSSKSFTLTSANPTFTVAPKWIQSCENCHY